MVGRSKSLALQALEQSQEKEIVLQRAVELYQKLQDEGGAHKGLRWVCREVQQQYFNETGKSILPVYVTLKRRLEGMPSARESNQARGWLKQPETEAITAFAIACGNRGFPLSHDRLREHINQVLGARLGQSFQGVGVNFVARWIQQQHQHLGMYFSQTIEHKRGRAVNPINNANYFKLLGSLLEEKNIMADTLFAADESGFQTGTGMKERVVGEAGKKIQYQQRDGNRETITVMVTICADGTAIPPAVIFKGKSYLVKWLQNNPLNAS